MKQTFEGKVRWRPEFGRCAITLEMPNDSFNETGEVEANEIICQGLRPFRDQLVRVSIEIEPVSLRDRVAKIFDEEGSFFVTSGEPRAKAYADAIRRRVLAEIDKERQAK